MKKISLREEQLIELNILKVFANFCDSHNLQYFLDSGTLIGAIRHKGFIPWDDDIDVCFLRKDYERFKELMLERNLLLNEYLKVEFEDDSFYPYLKIVDTRTVLIEYPKTNPLQTGIYIDIFPKDGLMSLDGIEKKRADKVQKYNLYSWIGSFTYGKYLRSGRIKDKILAYAIKIMIPRPQKYKNKAITLAKKYFGKECPFVSSIVCSGLTGGVAKECFSSQIEVIFEGEKFKVPIGYDTYLRSLYTGDYMVPPPPEKRVSHETEIYWKEGYNKI